MSSLRFLLDENVPKSIKRFLEGKNFLAEYVPKGVEDNIVLSLASEKQAILLTRDSDFSNRILYPPDNYFGIVIFKIHPPKPDKMVKSLSSLLESNRDFESKLFIVEEDGFIVLEG